MDLKIQIQPSLQSICNSYQGILLDAYGVFWNGNEMGLIPGAKEAMAKAVLEGKIIGILSNCSQLSNAEINKVKSHGLIQGKHFHFYITSGEIAKAIFKEEKLPFATEKKKFYILFKNHPKFSPHKALFEESIYYETLDIHEADFIYLSIPHINGVDQTDAEAFRSEIKKLATYQRPVVCVNPDHSVLEGNPPQNFIRQGGIAKLFEEYGCSVFYVGKPSSIMFEKAMENFRNYGINEKKHVLMVGDTPETDIKGSLDFGISSALIMNTGITANRITCLGFIPTLEKLFSYNHLPKYFIERLGHDHEL